MSRCPGLREHCLHHAEALTPLAKSLLDGIPLLIHNVALDNNNFIKLIDLSINDVCSNSLNSPSLDLILSNVENCSKLVVFVVGALVKFKGADLHILLLSDDIFNSQLFFRHELGEVLDLALEFLRLSGGEEAHEVKDLLHVLVALEMLNCG